MTASKRNSKTVWLDPDDAPELTDEIMDRAEFSIGDVVIRAATGTLTKAGRPRKADAKKSVHLRLSPDVLSYFRKTGPGWQTRIDETLRKAAMIPVKKAAKRRR